MIKSDMNFIETCVPCLAFVHWVVKVLPRGHSSLWRVRVKQTLTLRPLSPTPGTHDTRGQARPCGKGEREKGDQLLTRKIAIPT
jgi:hypothetical protein